MVVDIRHICLGWLESDLRTVRKTEIQVYYRNSHSCRNYKLHIEKLFPCVLQQDMIWMSLDFTDDQSTLVQVMAWCRQATSHYLSQCCPRSQSPHCVTRQQCVLVRKSSGTETEWNKTAYTEWWNNVTWMIVKYNCPNTVNKGIYIDMVKLKIGHITITLCAILLIIYTQIKRFIVFPQ